MASENKFPTIGDLYESLGRLVDEGFGDLPVQVLVVPDSTLQAVARHAGNGDSRPAMLIELEAKENSGRIPATMLSTDRMQRGSGSSSRVQ